MRTASLLTLTGAASLGACAPVPALQPPQQEPLVVFAAGSLIAPFRAIEAEFEAEHPEIDVQLQFHGSIQVIRYVTEIKQSIDVVASADHALMPLLMYSANAPDSGRPYGEWTLRFATNRLALAFTDGSRRADEANEDTWYQILADPEVAVGLSDPRFDPSGYRTLMALKLAETYYGERGIFDSVFKGQFQPPISWFTEGGETSITVPELLNPVTDARVLLRGSSIHLASLLAAGDVDYAFLYESVIRQQGFRMVELPAAVNLGEEDQVDAYQHVQVHLDFRRFASVQPEFVGEPISYGLTIPTNAPHPEAAAQFVAFLLGERGREVMAAQYHPILQQLLVDHPERLPEALSALVL